MKKRYERNVMTFSPEENEMFKTFNICVVGCGGLGGYVLEYLGRLGVGRLTAIDGDVFDESNLNRQILSDESVLGVSKAETAKTRMQKINSDVVVTPFHGFLSEENAETLIKGHHIVIDALDNIRTRLVLERACELQGIPLVHGAIAGWYGQVSVVLPGMRTLEKIYPDPEAKGIETSLGNPSFTPAMIAAIEAAEAMKFLVGRKEVLVGKLLTIDLLSQEYEVFEM